MAITYAVAYARFSSDNQREESIDAQLRAIRDYCTQKKYVLVDTYIDEAESAMTDDRPSFLRMIRDAKKEEWSVILVHKLDRFARNRYDSAIYKRKLKEHGVRVESVLEHLDDSPESVILESVLEGMAEYYSLNLGREVKKGHQENALKCLHNGGVPCYGFKVNPDGTYGINEHEAEAVRLLFAMITQGFTLNQISDELYRRGYTQRDGGPLNNATLSRMCHNEKYIGTYIYNRNRITRKHGKKVSTPQPKEEVIKIPHGMPAIVQEDIFYEVQNILRRRSKNKDKASRRAKEIYLLQGLFYCGNCGGTMVGTRRVDYRYNKERVCYECNNRKHRRAECRMRSINRDYVEALVLDYVEREILSEEAMETVKKMLESAIKKAESETPASLNELRKQLNEVKSAQNKLIDAIMQGLDVPAIKDKLNDLEGKKNTLSARIDLVEAQQKMNSEMQDMDLDVYLSQFRNIRSHSRSHQKEILQKFIKRVTIYDNPVDGDKIVLELTVPDFTASLCIGDAVSIHSPRVG